MSMDLDQACGIIEELLDDPSRTRKVKPAIEVVIASQDADALQLVTDALAWMPDTDHLEPLWQLVNTATATEEARVEAIRSIATILDVAGSRLAQTETELEVLLTQKEVEQQIEQLLDLHRQTDLPDLLRRKALENAASLAVTPAIHQAGKAALDSLDPAWVASGLYVIRQCDPEGALKILERYLTHPRSAVCLEAIQGYATLGHRKEYKKLADLLYNSKGKRQVIVLAALAGVPRKKAGELLLETAEWLDGEAGAEANAAYRHWVETIADSIPEEAPETEPETEEAASVDEEGLTEKERRDLATEEGYWVDVGENTEHDLDD
ncbi:MAG: hypothetical protein JW797_01695 [Bradymonadales bacterium]|nr:hypothetical protein [Bradymonadales bacterium]